MHSKHADNKELPRFAPDATFMSCLFQLQPEYLFVFLSPRRWIFLLLLLSCFRFAGWWGVDLSKRFEMKNGKDSRFGVHCPSFDHKSASLSSSVNRSFAFCSSCFIEYDLVPGIRGLQLSNPPVLETVALLGSLNVR